MRAWILWGLLGLLACSGGGTRRLIYEHSQEAFRASAYDPKQLGQIVVLPLAFVETENIEGIEGATLDWAKRAQEHLVAAFTEEKRSATAVEIPLPPSYPEVVEQYVQDKIGPKEAALLAEKPEEAKTYLAYKAKIGELPPREWARKWKEFANTFTTNPFASLARERAAALESLPPRYPTKDLRAFAESATHIAIPAGLKWVRSQTNIGGVEHQVFSAELELELLDAKTGQVVWRGYGIHKIDDQTKGPLDVSLQKAAGHVVKAAL